MNRHKGDDSENKVILIHDLPSLDGWQLQEDWLAVDAKAKAAPCQGCFGCWLKTPGRCVLKDSLQRIGTVIAYSKELILVSRCCYGGKLHHILRYHRAPALTVCFYGHMTGFERETAERMAQANRVNMECSSLRLLFAEGPEQVKEVLDV